MRRLVLAAAMMTLMVCLSGVTVATETTETKHFTGQIVTLDVKGLTISLRAEIDKPGAEETGFTVDPKALVRIHGPKGKLDQLKAGDVVTVKYVVKTKLVTEVQHM